MSANNPTYRPLGKLQLDTVEEIAAFRFVSHLGSICGDGLLAAGISEEKLNANEAASVISAGTALLTIKEQLAKGDKVASDATGFGVKATAGDFVNAIAMMAGVTNVNIEVELTKFKI